MDFSARLSALGAAGRKRTLTPVDGPQGAEIVYGGRRVLNLASNNYLGLANHPMVVEAVRRGLAEWGFGAGAARLICGDARVFHQLEERLAALKGAEAALLFGSGYQCNLALLQALAPEGVVFCDRLDHASLIDGARLSGARLKVYPHGDTAALSRHLTRHAGRHGAGSGGPALIATDGVFSMDGDLAPLPELAALARRHDALLLVDDAHGTGVLGGGRGSVHAAGLTAADVPVQMGTLGKALGGYGAFVAGSRELVDYLMHAARGFVFTTALPPAVASGALAALEVLESDEGATLRGRLLENRARLAAGLEELGWPMPAAPTPILPLLVGSAEGAVAMSRALLEQGILAPAVRPPTVPEGTSRLRLTVMASHTPEQIDRALVALEGCRGEGCRGEGGIRDAG